MADMYIDDIFDNFLERNYAEDLENKDLATLGVEVVAQVDADLQSREEWEEQTDMWMSLATQIMEDKNFPWPNASNVKYPLLATAAVQFHARAYPTLVNGNNLIKVRRHGKASEEKNARAKRVKEHMTYQVLEQMKEWQEDMDRLLYILPITGLVYKKLYYSPTKGRPTAPIILARDLIINYEATDFERAYKTHRIYMSANELREMQNIGVYLDCDLSEPQNISHPTIEDEATGTTPPGKQAELIHTLYECHGWWDLDNDGYKEPYIITIDKDSQKVLAVRSRWDEDGIIQSDDGEILRIQPVEYFIPYKFLPNPESAIYALGFGSLLGPLNAASNTLINQLIDAGTLSTLQGGFLSKQIRTRGGTMRFKPGEWKQVQATGDDLRKGIYPLPAKDPSNTLFLLLGKLIESGESLSTVANIMVGENPGQNQPYATTMAVLEQGLKVFTGIYKRVYRALAQEFGRLYSINRDYLDDEEYYALLDLDVEQDMLTIQRIDYDSADLDVIPGADPEITSDAQRILRAQSLEQKLAAGFPLNAQVVLRKSLEAEGHDEIEELMTMPPPSEEPELALKRAEFEHRRQFELAEMRLDASNKRFEAFKDLAQALSHLSRAEINKQSVVQGEAHQLIDMLMKQHGMLINEATATSKLLSDLGNTMQPEVEDTEEPSTENE